MTDLVEKQKKERSSMLFQKYFSDEVSSSLNDISHLLKQDFDLRYMDEDVKEVHNAKKQKQEVQEKNSCKRLSNLYQPNETFVKRQNLWKTSFHQYIDGIEYYKKTYAIKLMLLILYMVTMNLNSLLMVC